MYYTGKETVNACLAPILKIVSYRESVMEILHQGMIIIWKVIMWFTEDYGCMTDTVFVSEKIMIDISYM